ncbi:UNVERIFIED_CONTAM: peptidase S10, partial [Bacteroidetes bacterium 56_B9]
AFAMRHSLIAPLAFVLAIGLVAPLHAADSNPQDTQSQAAKDGKKDALPIPPERKVVTSHSVRIGGRNVAYKATAGTLL